MKDSPAHTHTCWPCAFCACRLLREYIELEFQAVKLPFPLDSERIVDDYVLFCMMVGNDFLPCESWLRSCWSDGWSGAWQCSLVVLQAGPGEARLADHIPPVPSVPMEDPPPPPPPPPAPPPPLDIAEGALNSLMDLYKQLLPQMGGYLTYAGELDRSRLEMLMARVGQLELDVLEERAQVGGVWAWGVVPERYVRHVRHQLHCAQLVWALHVLPSCMPPTALDPLPHLPATRPGAFDARL